MTDRTVRCRPVDSSPLGPIEFDVVGSDADRGVLLSIEQHGGRYEEGISRLLTRVLPPDGVAVDVGANIGVLSMLMAELAPRGRVHAFEPAPENFGYLRRNVGALPNVVARAAAVVDRDGPVNLEFNDDYPAGSFVSDTGGVVTEGLRLDTWVDQSGIDRLDVLKIDVEGAEPSVLAGATTTIRRLRPVTIVECNVQALRRVSGVTFADFFGGFRGLFDRVAVVEESGATTILRSAKDLELVLGHHGVVDLVGLPRAVGVLEGVVDTARSRSRLLALATKHTRRRPPDRNFVISPQVRLSAPTNLAGATGATIQFPVTVDNHGRWWLSSGFTYEPVRISYHWLDAAGDVVVHDGRRTPFPEPLRPGGTVVVDVRVDLPAVPGMHQLVVTLVQESFAWLDDIDPGCGVGIVVDVRAGAAPG